MRIRLEGTIYPNRTSSSHSPNIGVNGDCVTSRSCTLETDCIQIPTLPSLSLFVIGESLDSVEDPSTQQQSIIFVLVSSTNALNHGSIKSEPHCLTELPLPYESRLSASANILQAWGKPITVSVLWRSPKTGCAASICFCIISISISSISRIDCVRLRSPNPVSSKLIWLRIAVKQDVTWSRSQPNVSLVLYRLVPRWFWHTSYRRWGWNGRGR